MAAISLAVASGSAVADMPDDQACLFMSRDNGKIGSTDADYAIKVCTAAIPKLTETNKIAMAYMTRAQAWFAKDDYAKALADVGDAIRINPQAPGYFIFRADVSAAVKNYDQAVSDYGRALVLDPARDEVHTKRGAVFGLMGRLDDAIADLNMAIGLDPKRARAYYNRGLAWKLKGNLPQAVQDYQNALDANPADPHNLISRGADWEQRTPAAKAAILYQDIVFSGDMDTSGSNIQVSEVQETRFGKALLVSMIEGLHAGTILFNGKKVFDDDGMYVSIFGYFQSKDTDVILVSSNPGGSATPESAIYFLVIRSASEVQVVSGASVDTPDTDGLKKWMDKDGRIFVNLGYSGGDEMVAELDSGKLTVHAYSKKGVPLGEDLCKWLYDNGVESCNSDIAREQGCSKYANPAGIYSSVSAMSQLTYIRNQPGYSQAGFNKSCLAWCKGKDVTYPQFRTMACGAK